MPHILVKMFEGRTPEEKARLADAIVQAFVDTLGSTEASLSVAVQVVAPTPVSTARAVAPRTSSRPRSSTAAVAMLATPVAAMVAMVVATAATVRIALILACHSHHRLFESSIFFMTNTRPCRRRWCGRLLG